jgi:hypothetical protein
MLENFDKDTYNARIQLTPGRPPVAIGNVRDALQSMNELSKRLQQTQAATTEIVDGNWTKTN